MVLLVACKDEPVGATVAVQPTVKATTAPTPTSTPTVVPTSEPTSTPTVVPTSEPTATPTTEPTSVPTATTNPCGEIPGGECFDGVTLRLWPVEPTLGRWVDNETYEIEINQHLFGSALKDSAIVDRVSHNIVRIHTENNQGNFNLPQVEFGAEYETWLIDINFERIGLYENTASHRFYAVLKYGDLVHIVYQENFNEEPEVYVVTVLDGYVVWLKSEGELVYNLKTLGIGFIQAHEGGSINAIEGFYGNLGYSNILYPDQVTVYLDGERYHPHFVEVVAIGGGIYPNE